MRVGIQLCPQHVPIAALRAAWRAADQSALHSVYVWDHFFPLTGDPAGSSFECWTLLGAMAVETTRVQIGPLVTGAGFRNPNLLADMARTVDHLSGGRVVLGIGAGWFERDYLEYGYELGTAESRAHRLEEAVEAIQARLARLVPPPAGPLPLLIGGAGERILLPLVARAATVWNCIEDPDGFRRLSQRLDACCADLGRPPDEIVRTVAVSLEDAVQRWQEFADAGADELIVGLEHPFDLRRPVEIAHQAQRL